HASGSSATGLSSMPRPDIPMRTRSPGFLNSFGSRGALVASPAEVRLVGRWLAVRIAGDYRWIRLRRRFRVDRPDVRQLLLVADARPRRSGGEPPDARDVEIDDVTPRSDVHGQHALRLIPDCLLRRHYERGLGQRVKPKMKRHVEHGNVPE